MTAVLERRTHAAQWTGHHLHTRVGVINIQPDGNGNKRKGWIRLSQRELMQQPPELRSNVWHKRLVLCATLECV